MGKKNKNDRFQIISEERHDLMSSSRVLRDKETGVLYFHHAWGYGGGLTPLLDHDGKPLTDQKERDK